MGRCQLQVLPQALPLPPSQHATSDTVFGKGAGLILGKHHPPHPFGLQHLPFLKHHVGMCRLSWRRLRLPKVHKGELRAAFTVENEKEAPPHGLMSPRIMIDHALYLH